MDVERIRSLVRDLAVETGLLLDEWGIDDLIPLRWFARSTLVSAASSPPAWDPGARLSYRRLGGSHEDHLRIIFYAMRNSEPNAVDISPVAHPVEKLSQTVMVVFARRQYIPGDRGDSLLNGVARGWQVR